MTVIRKNDIVEIEITGMTAQGAGVGHWEGMAIFTPLTAPGDFAKVRIVKVARTMPLAAWRSCSLLPQIA